MVEELLKEVSLTVTEPVKYIIVAKKLIILIETIQPKIIEIQNSGVELPPHHQAQIGTLVETLRKSKDLIDKVRVSPPSRWNMYRQLIVARKMEKLEKTISSFLQGPIWTNLLADVHELRANADAHRFGYSLEMISERLDSMKIATREIGIGDDVPSSSSNVGMLSAVTQPQVFINFRGEELRNGFIAFLEPAMREANINVFIDNQEARGTKLKNLFVRIEESRVALVIFSKLYSTSEWCMNELVKIKECEDQGTLTVIPIFYKLEPWVVRDRRESFGDNYRTLKHNHKYEPVKTKKWKEALSSVAILAGLRLRENSDISEKDFINLIIKEVKKVLATIPIKEKPSIDKESNEGVFFVPARRLDIEHSEKPENWTWSFIYDAQSEANIEIVTLVKVYGLQITGEIDTRKLIPGIRYEVVFMIKFDKDTASGWEKPATLKLIQQDRDGNQSVQQRILCMNDYISKNWSDIRAGEFETPPKNAAANIIFCLHHHYEDGVMKDGLVIRGVDIRPVNQTYYNSKLKVE